MGFDRRAFLKFLGGATAGVTLTPVPWKLLDDVSIWTQSWSWIPRNIPGPTSYVETISKLCPSGTPVKVRLAGTRAIQTMPVQNHPLGGGLTPIAAAEVQMLNSPARVKFPLKRTGDGAYVETTWEEIKTVIIDTLKKNGPNTAVISGDENGSTNEVISAFLNKLGSSNFFLMPSEGQTATQALHAMGLQGRLGYDIKNSDCVLAIGANILESFGPVVANRRTFFDKAEQAALVVASPIRTNTAAVADSWLPIKPGSEGAFALGLAAELIRRNHNAPANDFRAFSQLCAGLSLEKTAELTGVTAEQISVLADSLTKASNPLVIVGSTGAGGLGTAPIIAGFAVNALLGNINKQGGLQVLPEVTPVIAGALPREQVMDNDLASWLRNQAGTQLLVLHEANPYYALPNPAKTKEALDKIPLKIAFTSFYDETAMLCDYILPIPTGLERYDDSLNPYGYPEGIYSVGNPAQFQSVELRPTAFATFEVAKAMGIDLGVDSFLDVVDLRARSLGGSRSAMFTNKQPLTNSAKASADNYSLRSELLQQTLLSDKAAGLQLAIDKKLALGTASSGIPPFNTKLLRDTELLGKDMFVKMNKATAQSLKLAEGDRVKITAGENAAIEALVHLSEGVANDTVAATIGFGHTAFDEFSKDKGANVMALLEAAPEPVTNVATWNQVAVNVTKA